MRTLSRKNEKKNTEGELGGDLQIHHIMNAESPGRSRQFYSLWGVSSLEKSGNE